MVDLGLIKNVNPNFQLEYVQTLHFNEQNSTIILPCLLFDKSFVQFESTETMNHVVFF